MRVSLNLPYLSYIHIYSALIQLSWECVSWYGLRQTIRQSGQAAVYAIIVTCPNLV